MIFEFLSSLKEDPISFFRVILESLTHPFYVIEANTHRIVLANSAADRGSSSACPTCYGLTHQRATPCDGKDHPCPLDLIKQTKQPVIVEHVHYDPPRILEIHAYPMLDVQGELTHIIEYSIDITTRKNAEKSLLIAKESAENANQAKRDFLSYISHEIRTPVSSIAGFAQLLAQRVALNPVESQYLECLTESAGHLLHLSRDLLDLARIESGMMKVQCSTFSLEQELDSIQNQYRQRAVAQGLEFVLKCAANVPKVICSDSLRLRQILHNLLGNALKHTATGQISLTISMRTDQAGTSATIDFAVTDTGCGIAPDLQHRLFKIFSSGQEASDGRTESFGLGLAISRSLAALLGGELRLADSEPGKGSSFILSLPCAPHSGELMVPGVALSQSARDYTSPLEGD